MTHHSDLFTAAPRTLPAVPEQPSPSWLAQGPWPKPQPQPLALDSNSYDYPGSAWKGMPLRGHLQVLRKYAWLIASVTVLITGAVALYVMRQPNIYMAQARIQINLETLSPVAGISKESSVIVNGPTNDPTYLNTQLQLLTSPELLREVARGLRLAPQPTPPPAPVAVKTKANSKTEATQSKPPASDAGTEVEAARLAPYVLALQNNLLVKPVKDTRLIDISFTHTDPRFAAQVTNTLVKTFVNGNLANKTEAQTMSSEFLLQRIAELQTKIRDGETMLVTYAQQTEGLSPDEKQNQNTVVERLLALNRQLIEAENTRKEAEAVSTSLARTGTAEMLAGKDTELSEQLIIRLTGLQQKYAELAVKYTDIHPEVLSVKDQITAVEKQLAGTRSKYLSTIKGEADLRYQQALSHENALRADFTTQRAATATQNAAAINYRILQQEVETSKNTLNSLLQRSRENDILRAGTNNNMRVSYLALVPQKPVGPNRWLSIVLAFFVASLFGVGLALGLGYLDDSIQTTEDVEQGLRLPALALIPAVSTLSRRRRRQLGGAAAASGLPSELLLNEAAPPSLAEAYKQLRTSVLLSKAGRAPQVLLVTSSAPAEGKTTTSVNIALSFAQTGAKVLVIDADLRRPRLHTIFGQDNTAGLSSLLSSELTPTEISAALQCHIESGLYILTSGPVPPNPAELLGSEQMRELLERLSSCFTHIVIDSPPVASFTDSTLLGTMVDGVLLVVQSGKISRTLAQRATRSLQDVGAKIIGVVLNNVTQRGGMTHYYDYYRNSYYDGDAEALAAPRPKPLGLE